MVRALAGLLRRLLLPARPGDVGHRRAAATGPHKLGIGRTPASTCPAATEGLVPSQKWRNDLFDEGGTERPWSAGDNIQLAIGQGDLQTNPLQMAIAYATLANGGTIVTPHVGMEVEDAAGRVLKEFDPPPRREIEIDPDYRRGDPRRPAPGSAGRRRHLLRRLRRLPGPGRRQDRARRSASATATSPGTWSWPRIPTPRSSLPLRSRKAASAPNRPRRPRCRSSKRISTSTATGPAGPNGGSPG